MERNDYRESPVLTQTVGGYVFINLFWGGIPRGMTQGLLLMGFTIYGAWVESRLATCKMSTLTAVLSCWSQQVVFNDSPQ